MLFTALQSTALEGVEQLINGALKYDPASSRGLAALQGQIILLDSSMPPLSIALEPTADGILLHNNWQDNASITIEGTLVSIASMALNSSDTKSLSGTGVNVSGDLETLRQLNIIMANLDIDWEAALAELFGDVAAHIFCSTIRNSAEFRASTAQRAKTTLVDVAQNQWQLTPDRAEFEQFVQQVRSITTDTDRLAARVERLRKLLPTRGLSQ
ncbi:MAG: hypothetical protein P8M77_05400 [Porticoccaceae bacterium]|nr:hypothetical protein [Porticoccaceae bacterium]